MVVPAQRRRAGSTRASTAPTRGIAVTDAAPGLRSIVGTVVLDVSTADDCPEQRLLSANLSIVAAVTVDAWRRRDDDPPQPSARVGERCAGPAAGSASKVRAATSLRAAAKQHRVRSRCTDKSGDGTTGRLLPGHLLQPGSRRRAGGCSWDHGVATLTAYLTRSRRTEQPPVRALHPVAWWLWALGLAAAASRTTNPLLLGMLLAVTVLVVAARRSDAPWAGAFPLYLWGAAIVVALRLLFRCVFGGDQGIVVVLHLPLIELPQITGLTLLGNVTAESLLSGLYDGLRLATMLVCLGAANALANPRRLLRALPAALHEVSTAVVVALSVFPQLAESVNRVRRARRLRPAPSSGRVARLRSLVIPVLEDALDRSLLLAASMDARGYGRRGQQAVLTGRVTAGLLVSGLCGLAVGAYAGLDATAPRYLALPFLLSGLAVGLIGIGLSGRGVVRSAYRSDSWAAADVATATSGLIAGALFSVTAKVDPHYLSPSLYPLEWPQITPVSAVAVLCGLLPLVTAGRSPRAYVGASIAARQHP